MSEMKGRKGRSSLGIYMERLNQRRWEEASCQDRNSITLDLFFWLGFVFDILGFSVNSLVSSAVQGAQEARL